LYSFTGTTAILSHDTCENPSSFFSKSGLWKKNRSLDEKKCKETLLKLLYILIKPNDFTNSATDSLLGGVEK